MCATDQVRWEQMLRRSPEEGAYYGSINMSERRRKLDVCVGGKQSPCSPTKPRPSPQELGAKTPVGLVLCWIGRTWLSHPTSSVPWMWVILGKSCPLGQDSAANPSPRELPPNHTPCWATRPSWKRGLGGMSQTQHSPPPLPSLSGICVF